MRLRLAVLLLSSLPLLAQDPWDAPAFSSEPQALLAAAAKVPAGDEGMVMLLDEATHSFETDGRTRSVTRIMYRIDEESAISWNDQVSALWAPWFDDKPVLAARVVTKDGTVHMLDAKAVTEAPARESSLDIFSDNRIVRAPLPAVAVGSVVEYTITTDGRSPIEGAGTSGVFAVGRWVPLERARLTIEGPASIQPRIVNRSGLEAQVEEKDGRRRTTFTSGRRAKFEHMESYVPFDDAAYPYIAFSTGSSWQDIAGRYAKIVDEQIAGSDLQKMVKSAVGNAKKPREIAARALAAIQKEIRYAGVEVAEGSIIPRSPATVLRNKYGDCKDKATLLVAMLREAGLTAHVALLRAGYDLDAHPDLPGLGRFNHAIVRVMDGKDELWIDPTDEFARAGELPGLDQGRMALIAASGTTSLTRTPELPAASNRYAETRIFTLTEHGKAPVVEITETAGASDAEQRRYYVTTSAEQYRENMEGYVKSYYFAKALESMDVTDPHDLDKPFTLTLKVKESGSGIVGSGEATVAMHPAGLFNAIPEELRNWSEPQPDDDPEDLPKPRVRDFVFPQPIVKEWTYRIVPPAGYVARELPKGETRTLGTTTFISEFSTGADGVVTARLRFDSGKRRITAKEYEETRVAISKLIDGPQIDIGFDMIGQAKLAAGDVAGALKEFRRLAALHPKEAQHHIELAHALLSGGLGEPAREEARLAVKIEPTNARAWLALGEILQHDLLGRRYRKGSDLPGAIEALRKAKELDPENMAGRAELARLLKRGDNGVEFDTGSKLEESAAEYRAIARDFGDEGRAYDGEVMLVLAHAGKFEELKELAAEVEDAQRRHVGRLLAMAATDGKEVVLRELGKFDLDTRRTYAGQLGQHLMNLRYYPEAAAMFEMAVQGTPNAASSQFLIDALRKARRMETVTIAENDPATILQRLFVRMAHGSSAEQLIELIAPDLRDEARKEMEEEGEDPLRSMREAISDDEARTAVVADLIVSMMEVHKDGNDEVGYRVRHRAPGNESPMVAFVTKEGDKFLLRAFDSDESVGKAALQFAERGEVDRARIWMNWARESVSTGDGEDPLSRSPFAMLWPKAKQTATAEEVRMAAAVQIALNTDEKADLLVELREKAATDTAKLALDLALANTYSSNDRWAEALPIARKLLEAYPESTSAFYTVVSALYHTGRYDEASAMAKKQLEKIPNDSDALRLLGYSAARKGDYAAAEKYVQQLLENSTQVLRNDFNNAAWYGLMAGNLDRAMKHALQATDDQNAESRDAFALHTLASIYAESDKPLQAREALLTSMDEGGRDQPDGDDWYVLGRIAETYGVREAAIAAYKRVPGAKEKDGNQEIAELVARRVAKLK